jgi:hypothetical protein
LVSPKLNKIAYGGDYSPEQWPQEIMSEDMRMFKLAGRYRDYAYRARKRALFQPLRVEYIHLISKKYRV